MKGRKINTGYLIRHLGTKASRRIPSCSAVADDLWGLKSLLTLSTFLQASCTKTLSVVTLPEQ